MCPLEEAKWVYHLDEPNLTQNPSKGFVVDMLTEDGNIQPYVIVQCRHA
jgi:hypothetical protein